MEPDEGCPVGEMEDKCSDLESNSSNSLLETSGKDDASAEEGSTEGSTEKDSVGEALDLLNTSWKKAGSYKVATRGLEVSVDSEDSSETGRKSKCAYAMRCFVGGFLLFIGIGTIFYTPLDLILRERIKMTPGFPAFDWWLAPEDDVIFKIYIFNVTNGDEFLSGRDPVLKFQEVGPIIYKEKIQHFNPIFHDNGTLTYTCTRTCEFVPELNTHFDMNATFYHPNTFLLGIVSMFRNSFQFQKNIFNVAIRVLNEKLIVKNTVYNYLWNNSNSALQLGKKYAPTLVPSENIGVLHMMYRDFTDESTVYIGPKWGDDKFFTLDKFRGESKLPGFTVEECPDTVYGASEGLLYPQRLTKNTTILYWRRTVCKTAELYFYNETTVNGVLGYLFILPDTTYYRKNSSTEIDCTKGNPMLPDGLTDLSRCYYNLPVALSLPHFKGVDPIYLPNISGMDPNGRDFLSFAVIEPTTGIPIASRALSQSNFVMGEIKGFSSDVQRFNNMVLPLFWMELLQDGLPSSVWILLKSMVVYLPWIQAVISALCIFIGSFLLWRCYNFNYSSPKSFFSQNKIENFAKKTILGENKNQKLSALSIR